MSVSHTLKDIAKIWCLVILVMAGTGCASIKDSLTNRIVCTVAKDKSFIASMWGFFGIVTPVDDRDSVTFCSTQIGESK